jgi:hypothetical protein
VDAADVEETIETSCASVRRCRDRVIEVRMHDGAQVDVPQMQEILAAQVSLDDCSLVVLVDSRRVRAMTRAAQQYTAATASERKTRAVAILIDSPVSTILGNFFLHLARPAYPTRLFRDEGEARAWLLARLAQEE